MLKVFADNIWFIDGDPIHFKLIPFETRMVIVRLRSGELWIHSPVQVSAERMASIDKLGRVRHLVGPNRLHAWRVTDWKAQYENAEVWLSPKSDEPGLSGIELSSACPAAWAGEMDQELFGGHKYLDEVLFLHRESRTLIVTDLIQRHDSANERSFWRMVKGWAGVLGSGGVPRDLRLTFSDRAAARQSLERVLSWDFDKCVIGHGFNIDSDAKAYLAQAFRWLLA